MSKKLIALLLALVFAVSCFPIGIFAVEPVAAAEEPAAPGAIIYAESTYCVIGKTVEVDICILNNPGVAGAKFSVSFDEGLTLVGASTDDGVFAALDYTAPNALQNGAPFNWDSLDAVATEDGKIITLTFEAAENLTKDDELAVTVSYKYGDIYDSALDSIAVTMVGGTLEVIDYVPGDANGDGTVNGKDVTVIRRYNANWDEDINLLAADVNGDGAVNGKDVTQIRRYNANWDVDFLPGHVACVHSVKAVEAKAPTCTEAGNVAYWVCSLCGTFFSDAEAQNEISELETVVPATGHTEVVDKAVAPTYDNTGLTEGLHCSVCDTVLTAQEVIPKLEPSYYSITYSNLQGAASPTLTQYASHAGVSDEEMPKPERPGYNFDGWYTAIEGGEKVVDIPAGTKKDYHLYARWSVIEYSITYYCGNGTNSPNNITSYTADTAFTFVNATLQGCEFYRWVDQNGNTVTEIKKGSTGNLILTAEYNEMRYTTVPISEIKNPQYKNEVAFADFQNGVYTYVYYLGYVSNVPLTQQSGVAYSGVGSITQGYEKATATTNSVEKGFSTSQSLTISTEITSEITAKEEVELGPSKTSVEASISASLGTSETVSHEKSISSAVSHSEEHVESFSFTIQDGSPHGYYRVAYMGTLDMFIAVVYDPTIDKIDVVRYSILRDETKFAIDYSRFPEFDGHIVKEFDFVIPKTVEDHILYLSTGSDGFYPQINGSECSVGVYTGTDTDVVLPTYLSGKKVTSFETSLFAGNTDITSVTFGEGITAIPDGAFEGCTSLVSVVFNGELTEIGANAFKGCAALEFEIPETVAKIGDNAFDGCQAMDTATISSSVTSLGTAIFNNCGDLSLTIHSGSLSRVQTAISSGATCVHVNWIYQESAVDPLMYLSNCTLTIPAISTFSFNGNEQKFENLNVVCDAADVTIEHVKFGCVNGSLTGENAVLQFSSSAITLRDVDITSNTTPLVFTASTVDLIVAETVTATAQHGYAGLTANNMTISSATGEAATFNVTGGNGETSTLLIQAATSNFVGGNGMTLQGDLTIQGFVTANIVGGQGGREQIANAKPGGVGIVANNILIDTFSSATVTVIGGAGAAAWNLSVDNNDGDGSNGRDGHAGATGGVAIEAVNVVVNSGKLIAQGGVGGEGGDASECNRSEVTGRPAEVNGGRGGNGGHGGAAIVAEALSIANNNTAQVIATGGTGGQTGRRGGCHDDDHSGYVPFYNTYAYDGAAGTPGNGGAGVSADCVIADPLNALVSQNGATGAIDWNLNQC